MSANKKLSSYKGRGIQKENVKISPNKNSHIKSCSSHSSSNTVSSSASSTSDEKQFGSGDLMDPELLGLTYIKGASTDSGFETAPCSISTQVIATALHSNSRSVSHNRPEQMIQWSNPSEEAPDDTRRNIYSVHNYNSQAAVGSTGDLSEISSHSSGSRHSGSPSSQCPKSNGILNTSTEYMVPPTVAQQKSVTVSRSFQRQGAVNKYVTGWNKIEDSPPPEVCDLTECQSEVLPLSNPLLNASMEEESERQHVMSKDVEDGREKFSVYGILSPRQSLYRTLSDESICSNRRGSSYASSHSSILDPSLTNDILFSTTPPYNSIPSAQTHLNPGLGNLRNDWFSDGSLSDKSKFNDLGLMSAPDSAAALNWSHLVNAARVFADQGVESFCSLNDLQCQDVFKGSQELSLSSNSVNGKDFGDSAGQSTPSTLTGKVNQLEVILRKLQTDLLKEKEDKAMLQAEVHHLRQYNIRLQEESQTASAQLRKFREWFFSSVDKKT